MYVTLLWFIIIMIWLVTFWYLFVKSTIFCISQSRTVLFLLLSICLLSISAFNLFSLSRWYSTSLGIFISIVNVLILVLIILKVNVFRLSKTAIERSYFRSTIPIEPHQLIFELPLTSDSSKPYKYREHLEKTVITEDNIKIRITHIKSKHNRVIIIAHGAFRHRHTAPYVISAQWLAYKYDVILFDFRGHGESSGFYDFSDKTILDIKAVIDYAKQEGYEKVGVFARSMGAWTTLLEAAIYQNVDSIVAAASPLGQIADISLAQRLKKISSIPVLGVVFNPIAQIIISVWKTTRISGIQYANHCPIDVAKDLKNIPTFLIYHEEDPVIETNPLDAHKLYDVLQGNKKLLVLAGKGHIFELSQFYGVFHQAESWFEQTLRDY